MEHMSLRLTCIVLGRKAQKERVAVLFLFYSLILYEHKEDNIGKHLILVFFSIDCNKIICTDLIILI